MCNILRKRSDVERRKSSRSRTVAGSRRAAIYVDYGEDLSKRSGIYVDTDRQKVPHMDDREDERTPLLQQKERLESQIIAEINRVDAQVDDLLPHAEKLEENAKTFHKIQRRKQSSWKCLWCCCSRK